MRPVQRPAPPQRAEQPGWVLQLAAPRHQRMRGVGCTQLDYILTPELSGLPRAPSRSPSRSKQYMRAPKSSSPPPPSTRAITGCLCVNHPPRIDQRWRAVDGVRIDRHAPVARLQHGGCVDGPHRAHARARIRLPRDEDVVRLARGRRERDDGAERERHARARRPSRPPRSPVAPAARLTRQRAR